MKHDFYYIYNDSSNNLDVASREYIKRNGKKHSPTILFFDDENSPIKKYNVYDNSGNVLIKILF